MSIINGSPQEQTSRNEGHKSPLETLEKFGTNHTKEVLESGTETIFGRDVEIDDLIKILSRKKKNNAILVGEPGVGKTHIVTGLVLRIAEQKVPIAMENKLIYSLDAASITAGTKYRGEMEERLKMILHEVENHGNIILFIDEIHSIMGGETNNSMSIANILKPHLTTGKLNIIGATTLDEYKKHFEKDGAMTRRFNKIVVDEPTVEACVNIIKNISSSYSKYHNVVFPDSILEEIPVLAKKYIRDKFMPDSAIDILDELGAKIKVNAESSVISPKLKKLKAEYEKLDFLRATIIRERRYSDVKELMDKKNKISLEIDAEKKENLSKISNIVVSREELLHTISKISQIPLDKLNSDGKKNIKILEDILNKKVINQDDAKNKIIKALKRKVLGLENPNKPKSFLFVGQSGGGKTYLSKLIADNWFDGSLVRIDMSEYQEKISSTALIGSPPGYVGYEQGGSLTEQVRRKPYSLVLIDEIEKAHPDILNVLLQILDEGFVTDSQGKKVDFKNTIIVMTSNLGARESTVEYTPVGFGKAVQTSKIEDTSIEACKKHFRPELWNRIDHVIVFNPLTKTDMESILKLELDNISSLLKSKFNIKTTFSKKLKEILSEKGFDKNLGARPLKRTVETLVMDVITDYIIDCDDISTISKITLDWDTETEKCVCHSSAPTKKQNQPELID